MTLCFVFIGNYLHSRFKIAGGGGARRSKNVFLSVAVIVVINLAGTFTRLAKQNHESSNGIGVITPPAQDEFLILVPRKTIGTPFRGAHSVRRHGPPTHTI